MRPVEGTFPARAATASTAGLPDAHCIDAGQIRRDDSHPLPVCRAACYALTAEPRPAVTTGGAEHGRETGDDALDNAQQSSTRPAAPVGGITASCPLTPRDPAIRLCHLASTCTARLWPQYEAHGGTTVHFPRVYCDVENRQRSGSSKSGPVRTPQSASTHWA